MHSGSPMQELTSWLNTCNPGWVTQFWSWRQHKKNTNGSKYKAKKATLTSALTAKRGFSTPNRLKNQQPLELVSKLTVTDNQNRQASDTVMVSTIIGKLNDTGITTCSNATNGLAGPITGYPGEDAQIGRDKTQNNQQDGRAGFSYTKINATGKASPTSARKYRYCVKNNVTGLIWETKTNDSGLHVNKHWTYTGRAKQKPKWRCAWD